MNKKSDKSELSPTLDGFRKPDIIDNFLRPNTQFIQQAKQLNQHAAEITEFFEKFRDELKITGLRSGSFRTGSGFLINTGNFAIKEINRDNFVEIIDFDPVRNNMMVIGKEPPITDACIHWFIYRGLPEINSVVIIDDPEIIKQFKSDAYPDIINDDNIVQLNFLLEILKLAKANEIFIINSRNITGLILIGNSPSIIFNKLKKYQKKLSKPVKGKSK